MPDAHATTVTTERARAKLTRSLRVVGRRADGYHLLEAEMVTLDLADELEITALAGGESHLELHDAVTWTTGEPAAGMGGVPSGAENLVLRALALCERRAAVRLTKRIPPGAGLGGGSADAAAVLRWAGVFDPAVAARLGADVPFCVRGGRARVSGVGEQVSPLPPVDLSVVLCIPAIAVPTAAVYHAFDEVGGIGSDGANDLEPAALAVVPELVRWRDALAVAAGQRPRLAGSGATWFLECAPADAEALEKEVAAALGAAMLPAAVVRCRADNGEHPAPGATD